MSLKTRREERSNNPPDKEKEAIQLVLQQAALLGEQWAA